MESTFRQRYMSTRHTLYYGFNPCFNGINIQTVVISQRLMVFCNVSILVLMESTFRQRGNTMETSLIPCFNPCFNGINIQTFVKEQSREIATGCFNPCFNGINIQTFRDTLLRERHKHVSILVLMESTFRHRRGTMKVEWKACFNPCFNGINIQTEP